MTQSSPRVSIVTPAYNEEGFLAYTLESVRDQTYDDIEHVVVNDGSTDGTADILERYEDTYGLRTIHQSNQGRPAAMNRGFDAVTGDIVFWLNGDDVIFYRDTIERIVAAFQSNPEADVIYGNRAVIDANNTLVRVHVNSPFFSERRLYRSCFAAFNYMRREVIENYELDTDYQYALDYDFFLNLATDGLHFHYLDEVLYCWREHQDTTETNSGPRDAEVAEIRERYADDVPSNDAITDTAGRIATGAANQSLQVFAVAMILDTYQNTDRVAFPIRFDSIPRTCLRAFLPWG